MPLFPSLLILKYIPHHNEKCYNTQKIDLALEVNDKLKSIYEVKTIGDTQSIYTAVGQLFMHSSGFGNVEKWIVLPQSIHNTELIECLSKIDISIIWFSSQNNRCDFYFNK